MAVGTAGFHHPTVHAARLLHQKKHRLERRCFLVEGPALLAAAIAAGVPIKQVFRVQGAAVGSGPESALSTETETFIVDQRTIKSLAQTKTPQGVVAVVPFLHHPLSALPTLAPANQASLVLVLHDLSDPGNAGTLVRSAEAFGAAAVCFGAHAVEPYNDKVVRASMGSLFRLPIVSYESWPAFREAAAGAQLQLIAAEATGSDVRRVTLPRRMALLIGQERRGVREVPAQDVHATIGLPQKATIESLNAAVAGSILLYELSRAQGLLNPPDRENK